MELRSDIVLKGDSWYKANQGCVGKFFDTQWGLFKVCLSIGILYDSQQEDDKSADAEEGINIPRNMFNRNAAEMQFFFQSAILTSNTVNLSEKDRLYLAFSGDISEDEMEGEDYETLRKGISQEALSFDWASFLKRFANYGATKISECVTNNDSETMENLMEFMNASYKGETPELIKMREVSDDVELVDYM